MPSSPAGAQCAQQQSQGVQKLLLVDSAVRLLQGMEQLHVAVTWLRVLRRVVVVMVLVEVQLMSQPVARSRPRQHMTLLYKLLQQPLHGLCVLARSSSRGFARAKQ